MTKIAEKEVEELLGKPVFPEFSDRVEKLRRNLLIISLITLGLFFGGLDVDPSSTLLGLKFKGLTTNSIHTGLLVLNVYMFIHFIWCAWDSILEWKLRITGTRQILKTTWEDECTDQAENPQQSTLYNWWLERARKIGNLTEKTAELSNKLNGWIDNVPVSTHKDDVYTRQSYSSDLSVIKQNLQHLIKGYSVEFSTGEHQRLRVSLKRFDNWYTLFLRSQNLRWLVIELALPIILGIFTIYILCGSVLN